MAAMNDDTGPPSSYRVKQVVFFGRRVPIVMQNENGPCPLLAIANVLLLRNQIKIHPDRSEIDLQSLMGLVADRLLEANSNTQGRDDAYMENQQKNLSDVFDILHRLATGIDVNVRFRRIDDFECTPESIVFDLLDIKLVHGWLIDPQDKETMNVIGGLSYNELMERLVALHSRAEHLGLHFPEPAHSLFAPRHIHTVLPSVTAESAIAEDVAGVGSLGKEQESDTAEGNGKHSNHNLLGFPLKDDQPNQLPASSSSSPIRRGSHEEEEANLQKALMLSMLETRYSVEGEGAGEGESSGTGDNVTDTREFQSSAALTPPHRSEQHTVDVEVRHVEVVEEGPGVLSEGQQFEGEDGDGVRGSVVEVESLIVSSRDEARGKGDSENGVGRGYGEGELAEGGKDAQGLGPESPLLLRKFNRLVENVEGGGDDVEEDPEFSFLNGDDRHMDDGEAEALGLDVQKDAMLPSLKHWLDAPKRALLPAQQGPEIGELSGVMDRWVEGPASNNHPPSDHGPDHSGAAAEVASIWGVCQPGMDGTSSPSTPSIHDVDAPIPQQPKTSKPSPRTQNIPTLATAPTPRSPKRSSGQWAAIDYLMGGLSPRPGSPRRVTSPAPTSIPRSLSPSLPPLPPGARPSSPTPTGPAPPPAPTVPPPSPPPPSEETEDETREDNPVPRHPLVVSEDIGTATVENSEGTGVAAKIDIPRSAATIASTHREEAVREEPEGELVDASSVLEANKDLEQLTEHAVPGVDAQSLHEDDKNPQTASSTLMSIAEPPPILAFLPERPQNLDKAEAIAPELVSSLPPAAVEAAGSVPPEVVLKTGERGASDLIIVSGGIAHPLEARPALVESDASASSSIAVLSSPHSVDGEGLDTLSTGIARPADTQPGATASSRSAEEDSKILLAAAPTTINPTQMASLEEDVKKARPVEPVSMSAASGGQHAIIDSSSANVPLPSVDKDEAEVSGKRLVVASNASVSSGNVDDRSALEVPLIKETVGGAVPVTTASTNSVVAVDTSAEAEAGDKNAGGFGAVGQSEASVVGGHAEGSRGAHGEEAGSTSERLETGGREEQEHEEAVGVSGSAAGSGEVQGGGEPPAIVDKELEKAVKEGIVIEHFLSSSANQLTYFGLFMLQEQIKENQLCVFFRNNHFNTMFKHKGALYLLATDQGYLSQHDLVWEKLSAVDGDTQFATGTFETFRTPDAWTERHVIANFIENIDNGPGDVDYQSDLQLAIALQQQELSAAERQQQQQQQQEQYQQQPEHPPPRRSPETPEKAGPSSYLSQQTRSAASFLKKAGLSSFGDTATGEGSKADKDKKKDKKDKECTVM